ncbi:MAG: ArsA family ATPase [Deltaproteobacteria bacterium]|nr:ArsA family ATPase [Deltaproteobacteria bacterium]MBW1794205.1 ArsA family ATPase [Deltaproteobacteria bacterium]MBW2330815.1 ArsA family ATPase [Deltaproteobacteria bacterium]
MRIVLFAGKGGVGKTSIAAASGVACAQKGLKTIIMSLDAAHSLVDSFDLDKTLMDRNKGRPIRVAKNLSIQEVDVQEEIKKNWGEVHKYISNLLNISGIDEVLAEELAILPGMEEVSSLLYINRYVAQKSYDVILLDCAPTGESIRFISIPTSLEWYMKKLFDVERRIVKIARPITKKLYAVPLPEDKYFATIQRLFDRLEGIDKILSDPNITTVRLVTNPEKIILKETQRAYMYFSLYKMCVDAVVINRILPEAVDDGYFARWKETQNRYIKKTEQLFSPIPILKVPMLSDQVVGMAKLSKLSKEIYGSLSPEEILYADTPYTFRKVGEDYFLDIKIPFLTKKEVDLSKRNEELIVRIGGFKRNVLLPRNIAARQPSGAKVERDKVVIKL